MKVMNILKLIKKKGRKSKRLDFNVEIGRLLDFAYSKNTINSVN